MKPVALAQWVNEARTAHAAARILATSLANLQDFATANDLTGEITAAAEAQQTTIGAGPDPLTLADVLLLVGFTADTMQFLNEPVTTDGPSRRTFLNKVI